jgi:hypothetical protein
LDYLLTNWLGNHKIGWRLLHDWFSAISLLLLVLFNMSLKAAMLLKLLFENCDKGFRDQAAQTGRDQLNFLWYGRPCCTHTQGKQLRSN